MPMWLSILLPLSIFASWTRIPKNHCAARTIIWLVPTVPAPRGDGFCSTFHIYICNSLGVLGTIQTPPVQTFPLYDLCIMLIPFSSRGRRAVCVCVWRKPLTCGPNELRT
ncbi:hypothetical protein DFS34DRAFT_610797 [Phlyctochytrium arcticum]|nr:hypothetical protein DFS34DRAFT_610797 [Phlyctochytrium arcticum]